MALRAKIKSSYMKLNPATGRNEKRFVWTLRSNSPKEIERYVEEQGENVRRDETGAILFFNKKYPGTRDAEVERVQLEDGTVIYRINMLEKDLQIEDLKTAEIAKLEAQIEVYGTSPATLPTNRGVKAAPVVEAAPAPETVTEGNEGLGDPL